MKNIETNEIELIGGGVCRCIFIYPGIAQPLQCDMNTNDALMSYEGCKIACKAEQHKRGTDVIISSIYYT